MGGTGTCGPLPVTVVAKDVCTLAVWFTPNAMGAHGATLVLTDNGTTGPQKVTLSGTGLADLTLSKTSLAFGSAKFGENQVDALCRDESSNPAGDAERIFHRAERRRLFDYWRHLQRKLGALKACTIIVTFEPGALGSESATVTVSDSPDPLTPYTSRSAPGRRFRRR